MVRDAGGCEIFLEDLSIEEADPMELLGDVQEIDALCFNSGDGQANFSITGGVAPFTVDWSDALVLDRDFQLFGLERGSYDITVRDASGCDFRVPVEIESPEPLETEFILENVACPGSASGSLLAISKGGLGPYAYVWEFDGSTGPRLTDVPSGNYVLMVSDGNGCESSFTGQVRESSPQLRMPTGFDRQAGVYEGVSNCSLSYTLMVYSKWGELLYVGSTGWDGTIKGSEAPMGTYSYMVEYSYSLDGEMRTERKAGVFTLIR